MNRKELQQNQHEFESSFLPNIQRVSGDMSLIYREKIQSLWSGLGSITRLYSERSNQYFVAKAIALPDKFIHPKGWGTEVSLERKVKSYGVESAFYQQFSLNLPKACRIPKLLAYQDESPQFLLMEDLNQQGLSPVSSPCGSTKISEMIEWLANFHAYMLDKKPEGLWHIGSYWHLETRQEEFNCIQDAEVKALAHRLHETLHSAQYKTIIHGDAKLANFCFGKHGDIAAVDFQYVGSGVGVIDVMYLFTSLFSENELYEKAHVLLDEYFDALSIAIRRYQQGYDTEALIEEWRSLYSVAWADFYRFLLGWSPQHQKINSYMKAQFQCANVALA